MADDARRLHDILDCAHDIEEYVARVDADDFVEDKMRQRAVERSLTIIGEAAKQLDEATRDAIDQSWREIIRFRDRGVHSYDSLTASTLYRIAKISVPALAEAVASHVDRRLH